MYGIQKLMNLYSVSKESVINFLIKINLPIIKMIYMILLRKTNSINLYKWGKQKSLNPREVHLNHLKI